MIYAVILVVYLTGDLCLFEGTQLLLELVELFSKSLELQLGQHVRLVRTSDTLVELLLSCCLAANLHIAQLSLATNRFLLVICVYLVQLFRSFSLVEDLSLQLEHLKLGVNLFTARRLSNLVDFFLVHSRVVDFSLGFTKHVETVLRVLCLQVAEAIRLATHVRH